MNMMTFLSVGAVFLSGTLVLYTGYTTLMAGSWLRGLGFILAGVFTIVAAQRIYDSREIGASLSSVEKAIAEAEYEMLRSME